MGGDGPSGERWRRAGRPRDDPCIFEPNAMMDVVSDLPGGAPRSTAPLVIVVLLVAALFYALSMWRVPLYSKGEAREALAVRSATSGRGSLILPRSEKPPLFHWLAGLAVTAGIGPEDVAVRLPSIVLGAGGVALTAAVAGRFCGSTAALLSAVILGSSFEWLRAATKARVDMTLTFCVVAATLAWCGAFQEKGRRWLVRLGYSLAGAGVLTKGPVGLVLPVLISVTGALVTGNRERLRGLLDPVGIGIALSLCAASYGVAWWGGGSGALHVQIVSENLDRFLGSGSVPHRHAVYYYIPALAGGFFPWTLVLPWTLYGAWRRRDRLDRFLLTWAVAVLGLYTLAAGKRSVYLLPLFPPLALLTARWLATALASPPARYGRNTLLGGAGVLALGTVCLSLWGIGSFVGPVLPGVRGTDVSRMPLALELVDAHRGGIAITFAAMGAGLLALAVRRRGAMWPTPVAIVCVLATVWAAGLTAFGTYPLAHALTPREFAQRVRTVVGDDDVLWACGHVSYAFQYYVGRRLSQWQPVPSAGRREFVVGLASNEEASRRFGFTTRFIENDRTDASSLLVLEEARGWIHGAPGLNGQGAGGMAGARPKRCHERRGSRRLVRAVPAHAGDG